MSSFTSASPAATDRALTFEHTIVRRDRGRGELLEEFRSEKLEAIEDRPRRGRPPKRPR